MNDEKKTAKVDELTPEQRELILEHVWKWLGRFIYLIVFILTVVGALVGWGASLIIQSKFAEIKSEGADRIIQELAGDKDFASKVASEISGDPIGSILAFSGEVTGSDALPGEWLPCDGREVSRKDWGQLFRRVGTLWGAGDGKTTFNIPDLRGQFLRGIDDSDGPGGNPSANIDEEADDRIHLKTRQKVGGVVGSYQEQSTHMPDNKFYIPEKTGTHKHKIFDRVQRGRFQGQITDSYFLWRTAEGADGSPWKNWYTTEENSGHTHPIEGGDQETRPENVYVNWIIRAR